MFLAHALNLGNLKVETKQRYFVSLACQSSGNASTDHHVLNTTTNESYCLDTAMQIIDFMEREKHASFCAPRSAYLIPDTLSTRLAWHFGLWPQDSARCDSKRLDNSKVIELLQKHSNSQNETTNENKKSIYEIFVYNNLTDHFVVKKA